MNKSILTSIFLLLTISLLFSQVGINTNTPNQNSLLHISEQMGGNSKIYRGVLTTHYTTAERDANFNLSELDNGLLIYNITEGCFNYWRESNPAYSDKNGVWISMCNFGETTVGPSVTALNCNTATFSPVAMTQGTAYSGTLSVPYTGGNGQSYPAGTPFTVNGLTFTLQAGTLSNNAGGNLVYQVTGTPTSGGNMNVNIVFGGQNCNVVKNVNTPAASITSLDCVNAIFSPTTVTQGTAYSGTLSVPYTGGNGQSYSAGTPFTVNGLTFTLQAGTLTNGTGNLIYNVSGTPTASGNMTVNITFAGQNCNVIKNVALPAGSITTLNCGLANVIRNANSIIFSVPYTGGNGGAYPAESVASTGTTGLTAIRPAGNFAVGEGSIFYLISNTSSAATGTYHFTITAGGQTCTVTIMLTVTTLNCAGITHSGTIVAGSPVGSGVTTTVPYTGSNGESYPAASVASTGVTGLTASIAAGNFALGSGNLVYTISGTPSGSGTANFSITVAGQTCSFSRTVSGSYPPDYVHCNPSSPTAIVELVSPTTGRIWMDRNMGASQAATSSTDTNSYGDLFQWGRGADGHQCRLSDSYAGPVSTPVNSPSNAWYGDFVKIGSDQDPFRNDWLNPHDETLWQGVNGTNNPCPSGFRVPTQAEWAAENLSNSSTAYNNLKLSLAGQRHYHPGFTGAPLEYQYVGTEGKYWSSTIGVIVPGPDPTEDLQGSYGLDVNNTSGTTNVSWTRGMGKSVRCIKN